MAFKNLLAAIILFLPMTGWANCDLNVPSLGAMRYNAFQTADVVVLMNLSVSCSEQKSVFVHVSQGSSNSFNPRQMVSGQNRLNYNFYTQTTGAVVWGDNTNGTQYQRALVAARGKATFTGNVRIPAGQNPPAGVYTDTVVFTVLF